MKFTQITPENMETEGFFCLQNTKNEGFKTKADWFTDQQKAGLKLIILHSDKHERMGFIEYMPAEMAWRPIDAPGYMFIQCIMVYPNKFKHQGYARRLIEYCENEAKELGMDGVVVLTSEKSWMSGKDVFAKFGYQSQASKGRFELLVKKFEKNASDPQLINWEKQQAHYQGWNLVYSDQCPYHEKACHDLTNMATSYGIDLQITKLTTAKEAKMAPSGFGTFSLLHDGKLLEDHYISKTRFRNIIEKELAHA